MVNKIKTKRLLLLCVSVTVAVILFMLSRVFFDNIEANHLARPVNEWKKALNPVGFTGIISDKEKFNYTDRELFAIKLKNVSIQNADSIPNDCEFFTYKNGIIKFAAYSETVNRWEDYGLEEGYFIEKKVDNDTMFVYTPDHQLKYVFELFDGIVNEWTPRQLPPDKN